MTRILRKNPAKWVQWLATEPIKIEAKCLFRADVMALEDSVVMLTRDGATVPLAVLNRGNAEIEVAVLPGDQISVGSGEVWANVHGGDVRAEKTVDDNFLSVHKSDSKNVEQKRMMKIMALNEKAREDKLNAEISRLRRAAS